MKKTLYLVLILLLVASSSVFAAQYTGTTTTVIGGGIFAPSVGVTVEAASAPTSFCANAGHTNGKVQYNTCSGTGLGTINPSKVYACEAEGAPSTPTATTQGTCGGTGGWK